jgi:hypothetical protein
VVVVFAFVGAVFLIAPLGIVRAGNPSCYITVSPTTAGNPIGANHTVTAYVTDHVGNPVSGTAVWFIVTSGPNAGTTGGPVSLDATGHASFQYADVGGAGTDTIQAYTFSLVAGLYSCSNPTGPDSSGFYKIYSDPVTKTWCAQPDPLTGQCPPVVGVPQFTLPVAVVSVLGLLLLMGLRSFRTKGPAPGAGRPF